MLLAWHAFSDNWADYSVSVLFARMLFAELPACTHIHTYIVCILSIRSIRVQDRRNRGARAKRALTHRHRHRHTRTPAVLKLKLKSPTQQVPKYLPHTMPHVPEYIFVRTSLVCQVSAWPASGIAFPARPAGLRTLISP